MKVKVSKLTAFKLELLLNYLEEEWSIKSRDKFLKKLDTTIKIIKQNPLIFPKSKTHNNLHKCVITKQATILYQIKSETIYIVTIFDNRQNPLKTKIEIEKHFG